MDFDVNTWRSGITVLSLLLFLALMAWTLSRHRRDAFDEAARLPFADEAPAPHAPNTQATGSNPQ
ncbi:cbb3-type cytochrome oxidase subunit 3 [Ideonella sp.]|uniref:cbb3-type cytochrome oxidase subunit 3 n=1 Tax=Ideonella sp. TaxID=1929293 RepID=UPI0035B4A083